MLINEAAVHLHNHLRNQPWFVKIRLVDDVIEVVVQSDRPKEYRKVIPNEWCGYKVEAVKLKNDFIFL